MSSVSQVEVVTKVSDANAEEIAKATGLEFGDDAVGRAELAQAALALGTCPRAHSLKRGEGLP